MREYPNPAHGAKIPFYIRIGVTGHRNLADQEALSQKIRDAIENHVPELFDDASRKLLDTAPNTQIAYTILTPLAEGADRLVAREVLKLSYSDIEVILPLHKDDYLEDFASAESRQEFEELFAKARRPITLREQPLDEKCPGSNPAEARREAYRAVGRYVVNRCDVLIALWDGEAGRGKGGTAEIVAYAEKQTRPTIVVSTVPPHNITVRSGYGLNARSVAGIEKFNSFPISAAEQEAYVANVYGDLFIKNAAGRDIPDVTKALVRERVLPFYARACEMAKENQARYFRSGFLAISCSALAVCAVAVAVLAPQWATLGFLVELILLVAIIYIVYTANLKRTHTTWLESRFLAERLRHAAFFTVGGVEVTPFRFRPI